MSTDAPTHAIEAWYVFTLDAGKDEYARLFPRLSGGEQARANEFLFLKDKLNFAAGRILLQMMLSQFYSAPRGRLVQNAYGKPALGLESGTQGVRFNISHTAGALVVVLARNREIGVDVESLEHEGIDYLDVARSQFTDPELGLLENLVGQDRRETFYSLWTLKEAYTKARGTGLYLPLSGFGFRLNPPSIVVSSEHSETYESWFFWQDWISDQHVLAIAAEQLRHEQLICRPRRIALQELLED